MAELLGRRFPVIFQQLRILQHVKMERQSKKYLSELFCRSKFFLSTRIFSSSWTWSLNRRYYMIIPRYELFFFSIVAWFSLLFLFMRSRYEYVYMERFDFYLHMESYDSYLHIHNRENLTWYFLHIHRINKGMTSRGEMTSSWKRL